MKKTFRLMALAIALCAGFSAQAAEQFNYSYTFDNGSTIEGSFMGTAEGNLISDLFDITAILNGVHFNGSGMLFGSSSDGYYGWLSGGAVFSFDGSENNFLIIDSDYPNAYGFTNYFYSTPSNAPYASSNGGYGNSYSGVNESWSVTPTVPAIPEPSTYVLLALGLGGIALARRAKNTSK